MEYVDGVWILNVRGKSVVILRGHVRIGMKVGWW